MALITLAQIKSILGHEPSAISIDSRNITPGAVFFAIKGEFVDGHDYIDQAITKGSSLIVSEKAAAATQKIPHIIVADSLAAFQNIAKEHLAQLALKKVAVTGSSGKTTSKAIIAAALEFLVGKEKVVASSGTQNNHFGVPLTALKAGPQHDFGVFELGMNHAGEIANLASIIMPDIAVITTIGSTHSSNFSDEDGIMNAKAEIYGSLNPKGVAIVNADNEKCLKAAQQFAGLNLSFGTSQKSDVRVQNTHSDLNGTTFELSYKGEKIAGSTLLLGEHNAMNSACSVAVLLALGFEFTKAVRAITEAKASYRRLEKVVLANKAIIIDDCYNASPESVKASLSVLMSAPGQRKIAILGDMLELSSPQSTHEEIGRYMGSNFFDRLYFCGDFAQNYAAGAQQAGFSADKIMTAKNSDELKAFLPKPEAGDIILVKGSRGMRMEKIVEHLKLFV